VPVFKETNAMSFVQKFLNIADEQARHVKAVKKVESKQSVQRFMNFLSKKHSKQISESMGPHESLAVN
jgi:hypothetical protein